ncbi:Hypothetical protein A7982_01681 [Minicystis rosea]|nr:Hypothetical protein A7982_01681 [Minicystis rosea]
MSAPEARRASRAATETGCDGLPRTKVGLRRAAGRWLCDGGARRARRAEPREQRRGQSSGRPALRGGAGARDVARSFELQRFRAAPRGRGNGGAAVREGAGTMPRLTAARVRG